MMDMAEVECMRNNGIGSDRDEESGLYPLMLAAMGKESDLDAVFEVVRRSPEVVKKLS